MRQRHGVRGATVRQWVHRRNHGIILIAEIHLRHHLFHLLLDAIRKHRERSHAGRFQLAAGVGRRSVIRQKEQVLHLRHKQGELREAGLRFR